jgi:hypothetical protein
VILRSISLKFVGGSEKPVILPLEPGVNRLTLEPAAAAALPGVLMTLLYPEETSSTDVARVAGPRPEAAWRVEAEHEGTVFRLSRGFSLTGILAEVQQPDGSWRREASGSSEVRVYVTDLLRLPPPTVTDPLNFWINTQPIPSAAKGDALASTAALPDVDDLGIIATDDYFGNLEDADRDKPPLELTDDERTLLAEEYRRNRTVEFVDDQLREAEARLDDAINAAASLADNTGELARLTRQLAQLPQLPDLSDDDRELLASADTRAAEFERRLASADADTETLRGGRRPLYMDASFLGALAIAAAATVASVVLDEGFRRLALINVAALAVVLGAAFRDIRAREDAQRGDVRAAARERRREQVLAEKADFDRAIDRLRDALPVRGIADYDRIAAQRADLATKVAALEQAHTAVFETAAYKDADAKRQAAQDHLTMLQEARRRCGDATVPSFELGDRLRRAGFDPHVVLWRPDDPRTDLARQVKRLGQVASKYRLVSESGLNPKTVQSWLRVAERIAGDGLPALNLNPEHQLVFEDGSPALEVLDVSQAVAVVQALRMSLHLTLVKARAAGIHPVMIDVFPERIADPAVRARLAKMYTGLGERLQVIVASAA